MGFKNALRRFFRERDVGKFPPSMQQALENQLYQDRRDGNMPMSDTERAEIRALEGFGLFEDAFSFGISITIPAVTTEDIFLIPTAGLFLKKIWAVYVSSGIMTIGFGEKGLALDMVTWTQGIYPEGYLWSKQNGAGVLDNVLLFDYSPEAKFLPGNSYLKVHNGTGAPTEKNMIFIFEKG